MGGRSTIKYSYTQNPQLLFVKQLFNFHFLFTKGQREQGVGGRNNTWSAQSVEEEATANKVGSDCSPLLLLVIAQNKRSPSVDHQLMLTRSVYQAESDDLSSPGP